MANTTIWQSTTGQWDAAASWTDGVPVATSAAVFDGTSQHDVTSGFAACAGQLLRTTKEYIGNLGYAGSHLTFGGIDRIEINGSGDVYLMPQAYQPYIVVNCRDPLAEVHIQDAVGYLAVLSGQVLIHRGSHLSGGILVDGRNAYLEIAAEATPADGTSFACAAWLRMGKVLCHKQAVSTGHNVHISGGEWDQTAIWLTVDQITMNAGKLTYRPTSDPGAGAGPAWSLFGGTADFSKSNWAVEGQVTIIGQDCEIIPDPESGVHWPPASMTAVFDLRNIP